MRINFAQTNIATNLSESHVPNAQYATWVRINFYSYDHK